MKSKNIFISKIYKKKKFVVSVESDSKFKFQNLSHRSTMVLHRSTILD